MIDSPQDKSCVLKKWVEAYLAWMAQNGYAATTIYIHKRLLGHFQEFVKNHQVALEDLFTYEKLQDFERRCGRLHAAWTLRRFGRYLFQKGVIPCAIVKPPVVLPAVYEEYLRFFEQNAQATAPALGVSRRILSALHDALNAEGIDLRGLRIEHIDRFLARYNTGLAPATRRHHRSYLRGFLRYLYHNRGVLERDLAQFVVGAVDFAHTNPPKFLRPEEIKKLFVVPETCTSWDLRCLAMAHLSYSLGLRPKEISLLSLDDVLFKKRRIRIACRKNCNPVVLPLPESAIKAIGAYIVGARPKTQSRALFLTLTVPFRPVTAATVSHEITRFIRGVHPKASAYWLRHTYAQHLLESRASIFEVKQMMGHDSLHATRKYLHIHTSLMRKVLFDESL